MFTDNTKILQLLSMFLLCGQPSQDVEAQRNSRWNTEQNQPPPSEIVVARWTFGHNGWFGGYGWAHNYPTSDQHFNDFVSGATSIDIDRMSYRIVHLGQDDVFDYPFAYISEPGEMQLTDAEVHNLREFVNRGGFVLLDDFDGLQQLLVMQQQVRRAFPNREWVALDIDHLLFHLHFDLDDLHAMDPYVPGGFTTYYAMHNEAGEIVMVAGHNNDLANFWDWYDQPRMPLGPATDAFRLGVNYMVYALTH
jgi:hypothetical protein